MEWSPQDAMNAYLHTLHLAKVLESNFGLSTEIIEPKCMELVSALATGKRAKLMVEVTTEGITPLTLALAAAVKQTGGQLMCILVVHSNNEIESKRRGEESRWFLRRQDLEDAVNFVHCEKPNVCEVIAKLKNVDFAVVDCKFDDCLKLYQSIDVNPKDCSVVVHNLQCRKCTVSFDEVVKGRKGVESVTLPIGEGIELTRIGSSSIRSKSGRRRRRRFLVTFEN
ncbi:hypothetical protein SLA2020_075890 [Shorea laevis]